MFQPVRVHFSFIVINSVLSALEKNGPIVICLCSFSPLLLWRTHIYLYVVLSFRVLDASVLLSPPYAHLSIVWLNLIMDDNKRGQAFNIITLGSCCVLIVAAAAAAVITTHISWVFMVYVLHIWQRKRNPNHIIIWWLKEVSNTLIHLMIYGLFVVRTLYRNQCYNCNLYKSKNDIEDLSGISHKTFL